jgi:hypothetical protein
LSLADLAIIPIQEAKCTFQMRAISTFKGQIEVVYRPLGSSMRPFGAVRTNKDVAGIAAVRERRNRETREQLRRVRGSVAVAENRRDNGNSGPLRGGRNCGRWLQDGRNGGLPREPLIQPEVVPRLIQVLAVPPFTQYRTLCVKIPPLQNQEST